MNKWRSLLVTLALLAALATPAAAAPSTWATAEVDDAMQLGIVPAALQQDYKKAITRSEFCALVVGVVNAWDTDLLAFRMNAQNIHLDENPFSDTTDRNALLCAAFGIVEGDGNGHFMPDAPITRQQAAKMLYLAADAFTELIFEDGMITTNFRGIASSDLPHRWDDGAALRAWARKGVMWCYRAGVMQGVGDNRFDFNGGYTREQAILTARRLYYAYGKTDELDKPPADVYPIYVADGLCDQVAFWVDSTLTTHTCEELGYLADPDAKYGFVTDNVGVGATYGHVIDRAGQTQFAGLYGSNGFYADAKCSGDTVLLVLREPATGKDGLPLYAVAVDAETGEIVENPEWPTAAVAQSAAVQSQSTGYYFLADADGNRLSDEYPNALLPAADNLYLGWKSDAPSTYDVLQCDGASQARVLRTETFRFAAQLLDLGDGLYAVQNTDTQITVFDGYGETISQITLPEPGYLGAAANGLLCVMDQANGAIRYDTPGGAQLPIG
ncbi:MAG: S-layer homology domain-containing protein [Oscillospiraceae bacterium]|nr:S-layer homology domain-containing protein [Oscillospiraceae bacterium]